MINTTMLNNSVLMVPTNPLVPGCTINNVSLGVPGAFFYAMCIMSLSLFFHELGHYICVKMQPGTKIEFLLHKGRPILRTGPVDHLNKHDLKIMYITGIVLGFIPITIAAIIHPFFVLLIAPYLTGCMNDIKEIIRLRNV